MLQIQNKFSVVKSVYVCMLALIFLIPRHFSVHPFFTTFTEKNLVDFISKNTWQSMKAKIDMLTTSEKMLSINETNEMKS